MSGSTIKQKWAYNLLLINHSQCCYLLTVKLSLSNCIISVLSLYDSSLNVSSSAMASSNAYDQKKSQFSAQIMTTTKFPHNR